MPSSQRCELNDINGPPFGESTSRRNTRRRNAPSDCPPGVTNSFKRSSGSSWTATLMSSSVNILTVSALVEDAIPRYKISMKPGQARRGTWKAIFPPASTACHMTFCLKHSRKISMTAGFSDSYVRSEEHTSELQSRRDLVCRLLLEKK